MRPDEDAARDMPVSIRPFLFLGGTYTSGLTPAEVGAGGAIGQDSDYYGYSAHAGLVGSRVWRRSALYVDYRANYSRYSRRYRQRGVDQFLTLGYSTDLTRRTTLYLTQHGGSYSRNLGIGGYLAGAAGFGGGGGVGFGFSDPTVALGPEYELFDNRVYFLSSGADLTFQKSARLSLNGGGSAFLVQRRAPGLADAQGYTARGDASWLLSRRQSVSLYYGYMGFDFRQSFGSTRAHTVGLGFTRRLSRRWTGSVSGGLYRLDASLVARVRLDPLVAAILGQSTGLEVYEGSSYGSLFHGTLRARFRHSALSLMGERRLLPGNGVYLTSRTDRVTATYSLSGRTRWSLSAMAGYFRVSPAVQTAPPMQGYHAGVSSGYRLASSLHLTGGYSVRRYENQRFRRWSSVAHAGLAFSPGPMPLSSPW